MEPGDTRKPSPPRPVDQMSISDAVLIRDLPAGVKVRLRAGAIAEVTANPQDGGWIFVRYLECPEDPSKVGAEDLAFCTDVIQILS